MALKIAFIRYKYTPFGGAERFTQAIMTSLAGRGAEVHIFARKWTGPHGKALTFHRVGGPSWPWLIAHMSFVLLVGRAVREGGFDLVQSSERTLCQDVYRAGDGVHARWLEIRALGQSKLRRLTIRLNPSHLYRLWLERRLFESSGLKAVITNSEMVRKEVLARFHIPQDRVRTIYNGVDLDRFHPLNRERLGLPLRRSYGVDGSIPLVLFVGSGFERKGLAFLIRGMAIAGGKAKLWVVGKGRTNRYQEEAERLGIGHRVAFLGPQEDVVPFYAASDIFVLPTMYDPFPTVVLEAMASGLPVITTSQCGAAEIIQPGMDGFVLDSPGNIEKLARYLTRLYKADTCSPMGRRAREKAEQFPLERTILEMEALYRSLLSL